MSLVASALFAFSDPVYYNAASFTDYAAVVSLTAIGVSTGIALILLWRDPPVARGSLFLLLAGIGAAAEGLGDLFEDVFDIEAGVWLFFGGGLVMMVSLLIAGIAALTVRSPRRWSGLFLLVAVPGALYGFGLVTMGVSWFLFVFWIVYQHPPSSLRWRSPRSRCWAPPSTCMHDRQHSVRPMIRRTVRRRPPAARFPSPHPSSRKAAALCISSSRGRSTPTSSPPLTTALPWT